MFGFFSGNKAMRGRPPRLPLTSHFLTESPPRTDRGLYPEPQNAPHVSGRMNVLDSPEDPYPKATDVNSWYGVYPSKKNHYILAQEELCHALSISPSRWKN